MKRKIECHFHRVRAGQSVPAKYFLDAPEPMCSPCFEGKPVVPDREMTGARSHRIALEGCGAPLRIYARRARDRRLAGENAPRRRNKRRGLPRAA
jgi:hypothetical protein